MASEHVLLTKEQFERLKNKREVIDQKNTTATQTEIPLQPLQPLQPPPATPPSKQMQEYANDLKLKDDEKTNSLKSKITVPGLFEIEENKTKKKVPGNKVSRKAIGHRRAPISKKLVNSKILKKEKKNKNSANMTIAWQHL
jgi:hypothetical protein